MTQGLTRGCGPASSDGSPRLWAPSELRISSETRVLAGSIGPNFLGPSAQYTSDYITRYAAKDPFVELLTHHEGAWMQALRTIAGARITPE